MRTLRPVRTAVWLLFNTTQLVASLVALTGAALLTSIVLAAFQVVSILIPVGLFGLGVGTGLAAATIELVRKPGARRAWISRGYRWSSAQYHYRLESRASHIQDVTINIQAIRSGVDHIENRYQPTASKPAEPQIMGNRHSMIGTFRRGSWTFYLVDLGRELQLGERETIRVRHDLSDPAGTFVPFLAKTVVEPIGRLTLRVSFPPTDHPSEIRQRHESAPSPSGALVEPLIPVAIDPVDHSATYVIRRPALGHRYALEWDWIGQPATKTPSIEAPPALLA